MTDEIRILFNQVLKDTRTLEDTVIEFDAEIMRLEENRKKALEHIEKHKYWNGEKYYCTDIEKLVDILGGE